LIAQFRKRFKQTPIFLNVFQLFFRTCTTLERGPAHLPRSRRHRPTPIFFID